MATIRKIGERWQVQVRRYRRTITPLKRAAKFLQVFEYKNIPERQLEK